MILQGRGPEYVIQNKLSSAYQLRRPGKPKRPRVARRPCPSFVGFSPLPHPPNLASSGKRIPRRRVRGATMMFREFLKFPLPLRILNHSSGMVEEALSSLRGKKTKVWEIQSVSQEWRSSMILQGRGPERVFQTQIHPHTSFGVLKRQSTLGLQGGLVLPFVGKRKKCRKKGCLQ